MVEPSLSSSSSPSTSSRPSGWNPNQRVMQRYSCLPCRKRKSKCDRAEPCLSCVLRGTEDYCYTNKEYTSAADINKGKATHTKNDEHHNNKTNEIQGGSSSSSIGKHSRTDPQSPPPHFNDTNSNHHHRPTKTSRFESSTFDQIHTQNDKALKLALDTITNSVQDIKRISNSIHHDSTNSLAKCGQMVHWEIVESILPTLQECEEIVHCFFTELEWYQSGVDRDSFNLSWEDLFRQRKSISRQQLALICVVIAFTLLLTPQGHPAARLPKRDQTNSRWQIENARLLIEAYYHFPSNEDEEGANDALTFGSESELLSQLQVETMFCYYCAVDGLLKKAWFSLGKAIRLGRAIELFDESRWSLKREQREWRRKLAWDLITMDRWCSLHIGRAGELMAPANVGYPKATHPETLIRNHMVELIRKVFEFSQKIQNMEISQRFSAAQIIDSEAQQFFSSLPNNLRFDYFLESMATLSSDSMKFAAPALTFYFSVHFLRLVIMRPFLMDTRAPIELQFASLRHAKRIIELMPHLVSLANNPSVSFPAAWNIQFLFAAAATFASVVLSKDEIESKDENQEKSTNSEQTPMMRFGNKPKSPSGATIWPEEELEWFTSKLFNVIDTFDLVCQSSRGHTAKTCKNLLLGLCNSRKQLRKRFQEREKLKMSGSRIAQAVRGNGMNQGQPLKKKSLPSIFSGEDNSERQRRHNKNESESSFESIPKSNNNNNIHNDTPFTPDSNFSSNVSIVNGETNDAQKQEIGTVSASEILARMESNTPSFNNSNNNVGGGGGSNGATSALQGNIFGINQLNFEVPFLDFQEWANLTSNLNF